MHYIRASRSQVFKTSQNHGLTAYAATSGTHVLCHGNANVRTINGQMGRLLITVLLGALKEALPRLTDTAKAAKA